ncbi:hypothetical protein D9M71_317580 [compost metagenome]
MIELITISRFIIDFLWEYKLLNILHTLLALVLISTLLLHSKRRYFSICNTDFAFLAFFIFSSIAWLRDINNTSSIEFLKFSTYIFFYFAGRSIPTKLSNTNLLEYFSSISLLGLTLMALLGVGYQTWGKVNTFTGGYYFKTDLAIAALIFLSIVFATSKNKFILTISLICTAYLVFKSNARIALPLVGIIPVLVKLIYKRGLSQINLKTISTISASILLGIMLFALIDFKSLGMLGFDFSDPFSASNTQGRTVIWAAILHAFENATAIEKLIGLGLDADIKATGAFSDSSQVEGFRAHNSYLYLLICMGFLGSASFYILILTIVQKIPFSIRNSNNECLKITTIVTSLILLFAWLSLTTEIIIRAQLMVPLFFFAGLHVQNHLKLKKHFNQLALRK